MNKKLRDPIGMLFNSLETVKAQATGKLARVRADALTVDIEGFTVDTCDTVDAGWETGVKPTGNPWIIVEHYADKAAAIIGHEKWVKSLTENPKLDLSDINYI